MHLPISTREAIERSDFSLTSGVRQMKALEAIKTELDQQAKCISRALNTTSAKKPDDLVFVPGGLDDPSGANPTSVEELEQQHHLERTWKRVMSMATGLDLEHRKAVAQRMKAQNLFRLVEVEARLEKISERRAAIKKVTGSFMLELEKRSRATLAVPA